jgi:hypothetical protein
MGTPSVLRYSPADGRLPILLEVREGILPALVAIWTALVTGFAVWRWQWAFAAGVWATVTTIMLWPVGRRLGRPYLSYRTPYFILGVLSMGYILFAGFMLQWARVPFLWKSLIFWGLVADLTVFGLIPGLRTAIGRPLPMFFRPDLIFGDGRVLCCGIVAMVLGMRYLIGSPPMGVPWPVPRWNWWAILVAMLTGFIPMIPLRGVTKLLMRIRRMRDGQWGGWGAIFVRELLLVVAALGIGYGFHNAFLGAVPFTVPLRTDAPGFWTALAIMIGSTFWLVVVRGGYKRYVGDPFIRETIGQSVLKQVMLVVGLIPLYYGFMSILHMDPMHLQRGVGGLRTPANMALIWPVGLPIFLWGLTMLVPFRVLIQYYQREALVAQMAAVILPSFTPEGRRRVLVRVLRALAQMPEAERYRYMRVMQGAIAQADDRVRAVMTLSRMEALAELRGEERRTCMVTMDRVLRDTAALAPAPEPAAAPEAGPDRVKEWVGSAEAEQRRLQQRLDELSRRDV